MRVTSCDDGTALGRHMRHDDRASLHDRLMDRALAVARSGLSAGEMPIGAVVAIDDEVIAEAHTQERTQRRLLVHAELLALDQADRVLGRRRAEATIYTTLEPCLMCLGAAFTTRLGSVVYALESPSDGASDTFSSWDRNRASHLLPGYTLPRVTGGIRRAESATLFDEYAAAAPPGWAQEWAADPARLGRN